MYDGSSSCTLNDVDVDTYNGVFNNSLSIVNGVYTNLVF